MDPVHARYPFLPAARDAVGALAVDLGEVVERDDAVVERARERVERSIESRTVGDPDRSDRVELLSYPVARVLVSLLDEPALTHRYASAEAETAVERLRADGDGAVQLRSAPERRLTTGDLLDGLGLADDVREVDGSFEVAVGPYLRLADGLADDRWRLVNRSLANGWLPVTAVELSDLLRSAIRDRVEADLPLAVPESVAVALDAPVAALRSQLSDFSGGWSIDAVEPERFPPCVKALEAQVRAGEPMTDHATFAYVTFMAAIGMDEEAIVERLSAHPDVDESVVRYRLDHLLDGDDVAYLPPSCATMQAQGDCVNRDELCARIPHPLEYYDRRLAGVEPGAD